MSDNYRPTTSLRFVERKEESGLMADGERLPYGVARVVTRKILQQRWTSDFVGEEAEWRDVVTTGEMPNSKLSSGESEA